MDFSIYANLLRPPKSIAQYRDEDAGRQQNALALRLNQAKLAEFERAQADDAQYRQTLNAFGADPQQNVNALMRVGRFKEAQDYSEMQQRQQAAQTAAAQARAVAALRGSIPSPQMEATQTSLAGGGGPTVANAERMPAVDPRMQALYGLMQAGGSPADYIGARFPQRKVARTIEGTDAQGGKIVRQFADDGTEMGAGVAGYVAPVEVNQGDKRTFVVPRAGTSLPVGMSPSERDASARGWAGVRQGDQRIALDRENANKPKGGNPRTGPMSVTLQKELLESDDAVQSAAAVVRSLQAAKAQNDKAYDGYFAKPRAQLVSNLGGSAAADATIDIDNLMTGQGLESLKSIFGAAPTEGERKILMDMQASVDKTPKQRAAIMDRAIAAAERRAKYADAKARAIRDGSYLTDGVPAQPAEAPAGPSLDDLLKKYGN
jgi:hypothetical protein